MDLATASDKITTEDTFKQFLLAHGGPFYELQRQLGLLHEHALHAGWRALLFIGLCWGVPLLMTLFSGTASGSAASGAYLLDLNAWARFFIAASLFILMERQVERRLNRYLLQFVRAPLLAPESFQGAANAVSRALRRRDNFVAEAVCLIIGYLISIFFLYGHFLVQDTTSWSVQITNESRSLTLAGWWVIIVSNPIYVFLMFRWFWRMMVWGMLLRELARLELNLVATHPDGNGGLAFISQYPNAYSMFVFAISCVLGAAVANALMSNEMTTTTYGFIMPVWLVLVLGVFALPLLAFNKPLRTLKDQTLLAYDTLATCHNRAKERETIGRNIMADSDEKAETSEQCPDPAKDYALTQKLSTLLFSRATLLPLSAASLLPLVVAGTSQLPLKEIIKSLKPLLLL